MANSSEAVYYQYTFLPSAVRPVGNRPNCLAIDVDLVSAITRTVPSVNDHIQCFNGFGGMVMEKRHDTPERDTLIVMLCDAAGKANIDIGPLQDAVKHHIENELAIAFVHNSGMAGTDSPVSPAYKPRVTAQSNSSGTTTLHFTGVEGGPMSVQATPDMLKKALMLGLNQLFGEIFYVTFPAK